MKRTLSKHTYYYLILSIAILFITTQALAEEPTNTPPLDQGQATKNINENALERKTNQDERQLSLSKKFQERIINLCQNITKRLTAGTDRMANITTRIESRIEKLKAQGIDTTMASAKLSEAKSSLSITYTIISQLGSAEIAIGSDTPKESFGAYRIQFNEARISLQNTHRLLLETIELLKTAPEKSTLNGTSTDTIEVQ